jgi:DNA-binding MarR family transcriptional regulator
MSDSIPADELNELRRLLRAVTHGLHGRGRPPDVLIPLLHGDPQLGRRHLQVLSQVAGEEGRTVGDLARELGLSLPAASKLVRDLEDHTVVRRSEDPEDRRRTVVDLDPRSADRVRAWLAGRNRPLEQALEGLTPSERTGFLKGLAALAGALMEESAHGPVRSKHRRAARRGPHRHRPL